MPSDAISKRACLKLALAAGLGTVLGRAHAAQALGFKLIKIAAPDGDRLLAAVDSLAAQRA
ncbi:hypothetical protein [Paucibacter soli]|uniref:hypothetical protein n=1 Tax=Paucibacter soli TaxID=3133433 RepID=UPI0040371182